MKFKKSEEEFILELDENQAKLLAIILGNSYPPTIEMCCGLKEQTYPILQGTKYEKRFIGDLFFTICRGLNNH